MNRGRGFWLWAVSGALLALSVLGILTIGIFVLPFALMSLWVAQHWAPRGSRLGLPAGAGLLVLTLVAIGTL
jgi:hypothetical protein